MIHEEVEKHAKEILNYFPEHDISPEDAKKILAYLYAGIDEALDWMDGGRNK